MHTPTTVVCGALLVALLPGGTGLDPTPDRATPAPESLDGPGHPFNDPFIENLLGDWSVARAIRGREEKNTAHVAWVLQHQFLQMHMTHTAQPPKYEAIVMIGFSHAEQMYVAHWCDVFGGRYSAMGKGVRKGNSIEFRFEYPDGPFFNTFS